MDTSLKRVESTIVLSLRRRFVHDPDRVWTGFAARELLKRWFPCDVEGEWKANAPLEFRFLDGEGDNLPEEDLRGEVLTADAPRLLEFRWGTSLLRCEMVADGNGCQMSFSETLDDPSEAARNAAGWEMCLENLAQLLDGEAPDEFAWEIWQTKFEGYVKKFEAEAGPQQGPPVDFSAAGESSDAG